MSAQREPRREPERTRLDDAINELMRDGMRDPSEIASTIITTRKLDWRRFAYSEIEYWIVTVRIREFFRKGKDHYYDDELVEDVSEVEYPPGIPHRSAKERVLGVGSEWVHLPSFGGYKWAAECTSEELREGARYLEVKRDGYTRRIDAMYELADRMDAAKAKTRKDLP